MSRPRSIGRDVISFIPLLSRRAISRPPSPRPEYNRYRCCWSHTRQGQMFVAQMRMSEDLYRTKTARSLGDTLGIGHRIAFEHTPPTFYVLFPLITPEMKTSKTFIIHLNVSIGTFSFQFFLRNTE